MKGRGVRIDLLLINLDALKEGGGFLQQISLVLLNGPKMLAELAVPKFINILVH